MSLSFSSDVSEHVEVGCYAFLSCLTAGVRVVAAIMASPSSLHGEAPPEPQRLISSCTHDSLLVWTEGDVEDAILVS